MPQLENKVAIVTGGASGIGKAIVAKFVEEGARVILADINPQPDDIVAEALEDRVSFMSLDVSKETEWERVVAETEETFGQLNILVNNAGISKPGRTFDFSLDDWKQTHAVNVEGAFLGIKHAVPVIAKYGSGAVVNMSALGGIRGVPRLAAYCTTKGAITALTKSVALECAAEKLPVRINALLPGFVVTPIWNIELSELLPGAEGLEVDVIAAAKTPMGRSGTVEEIANAALFLASEESSYMTGSELVIDGGVAAGAI
jgi:NAD(P)-dependent dehydrogenase (short-subunit alcohol dehydrogenase family)